MATSSAPFPDWNPDQAKARAKAFLNSDARVAYSKRRLSNDHDDLQESASAGMQILKEHGQDLLNSLLVPQKVS
jgi:hypothetical protein